MAAQHLVPSTWPGLLAVGIVALLSTGVIVIDIVGDRETEGETSELVDNALRSVALIDDLRRQTHELANGAVDRKALAYASGRIAADAAMYEPLATYLGEREEWTHLQDLIARLEQRQTDGTAADVALPRQIEASLDRLVRINELEAAHFFAAIRLSYRNGLLVDLVGGAVVLVLALVIARLLLGAIRRQRALVAAHLELEDARKRELEAFAGRVAHDLRAPLTPIQAYADVLQLGGGPPPEKVGQQIAKATRRLTEIIDDLLALSVSGHPGVGQADVATVVAQVLEDLEPQLGEAKVDLAVADTKVRCPAGALGGIVSNLVSNAIKYRASDRPLELGIRATRHDGTVELLVSDNGIGMDAATASHIFDPMFRASAVRTIEGHGLGLAIVKRTIDALGGTYSVETKLGEGTRIIVRLPA
jgi:signal transduction histidine kinase